VSKQKHRQPEAIGKRCCMNGYVEVEEAEVGLVVGKSYWSSLTWVRFEEEENFE
jgi:hypothetical protein